MFCYGMTTRSGDMSLPLVTALALVMFGMLAGEGASGDGPLDRVRVEDTMLADAMGNSVGNEISIMERVQITSTIINTQDKQQPFQYIIQIKNEAGIVDAIRWISMDLGPNQNLAPAASWAPKKEGVYTAEIYVWGWEKIARDEIMYESLSRMTMFSITVT